MIWVGVDTRGAFGVGRGAVLLQGFGQGALQGAGAGTWALQGFVHGQGAPQGFWQGQGGTSGGLCMGCMQIYLVLPKINDSHNVPLNLTYDLQSSVCLYLFSFQILTTVSRCCLLIAYPSCLSWVFL